MNRSYAVNILSSAEKDIGGIAVVARTHIFSAIVALAENPRPVGFKKMEGYRNLYRIRVGQYRIVYEIDDKASLVIVAAVAARGKIYHLLKRR